MMYWGIFRHTPREILEYRDLFGDDLNESDMNKIITFLEQKKEESENMVEMGFDEDGEQDEDIIVQKDHEIEENEQSEE